MRDLGPLLVLLALGGGALTVLGALFVWLNDESRRIRRSLKKVLQGEPQAVLIAAGRGVGFEFGRGALAVTWDGGAWCLVYRLAELAGAELILDHAVAARVHRGEARRPLERVSGAEALVRLRLLFDDPAYPDFELDVWTPAHTHGLTATEATHEANRWMARFEAVLRQAGARRPTPPSGAAAPAPAAAPRFTPLDLPFDDAEDEDEALSAGARP